MLTIRRITVEDVMKRAFSQFEIARSDDFTEHLNRYNTISVEYAGIF